MTRRCVVGFLSDIPSGERMLHYERIARMTFEVALEQGLTDCEVEYVAREVNGLPRGEGDAVVQAYEELVAAGAVAVIGPFVTDNAAYLKPTIERVGVPSISWCGSANFLGPCTFTLPNGSLQDEGPMLALYAHREGYKRIAAIRDDSEIGETYWFHFARAAQRLGLEVVSLEVIDRIADDATSQLARSRAAEPDLLVYLGYGMSLLPMQPHFADWPVARLATTAFVFCYRPEYMPAFEGWTGLDQLDPANPVRVAFLELCRSRMGYEPDFMSATLMFDSARVLSEAFAIAEELEPASVRAALERVRLIPAASGGAGTTISFGNYSHKGWEGTRYLVVSRVRDGASEFVSYIEPDGLVPGS